MEFLYKKISFTMPIFEIQGEALCSDHLELALYSVHIELTLCSDHIELTL